MSGIETMRSFMGAYRVDVNERDEEIARLTDDRDFQSASLDRVSRELATTKTSLASAQAKAERNREAASESARKAIKLEGVIESLNLDLGNEREAHTAARDRITELEETIRALGHEPPDAESDQSDVADS